MATPSNYHPVDSPAHFQALLSEDLTRVSLLYFWAPWAAPCKQMNEVVLETAKRYPSLLVLMIEAEEQPDISESFEIEAVPSLILLRGHTLLSRISGADAQALQNALASHLNNGAGTASESETPEQMNARLKSLMNRSKVVLFMKGTPEAPRCGFSRQTVEILKKQGVAFDHFDILSDDCVRSGLKVINNWPTFPQLIVNGEFVGGLDIIKEMVSTGEFGDLLGSA
ncbi:glutaredoxin [Dacryopinax primogenitus]|uniref:Glutaredoxin n=1 Tax=Dacryopinax primogenitus (strain DJM 731) TaxID=1858805 RepID=M5G961_DACPD|nr:glutaredoxin [Dacryopinax primogenitus]EJU04720.1 glutaredoxin [Dacryopinax primogenitus]